MTLLPPTFEQPLSRPPVGVENEFQVAIEGSRTDVDLALSLVGSNSYKNLQAVEVVALMIGDIIQCYSENRYDSPQPLNKGLYVKKGCPKSLYRPGSSTDILLFEKDRVTFSEDLRKNSLRQDVNSRFSAGLGRPLVETDLQVRSTVAFATHRSTEVSVHLSEDI